MSGKSLHERMEGLGRAARAAQRCLATSDHTARQAALRAAARNLRAREAELLEANADDLEEAKDRPAAFRDRLALDPARIAAMAGGLEAIAARPDPVGVVDRSWSREDGLAFERVRVPLGVIAVIFESRPNVAADAAGLAELPAS